MTTQFDNAMHALLGNPADVVGPAIELLVKIVSNIMKSPSEEKYRKISSSNATFVRKLGQVDGGNACMVGLGFQLRGTDWILDPSGDAWVNLNYCLGKLERFQMRLQSAGAVSSGQSSASNSTVPSSQPPPSSSVTSASVVATSSGPPAPGTLGANELFAMQQLFGLIHSQVEQQQQQQEQPRQPLPGEDQEEEQPSQPKSESETDTSNTSKDS